MDRRTIEEMIGFGISVALLSGACLVYNHARTKNEGEVAGLQWYRSPRFIVKNGDKMGIVEFEGAEDRKIKLRIPANPIKGQFMVPYDKDGKATFELIGNTYELKYDESAGLLQLVDTEK